MQKKSIEHDLEAVISKFNYYFSLFDIDLSISEENSTIVEFFLNEKMRILKTGVDIFLDITEEIKTLIDNSDFERFNNEDLLVLSNFFNNLYRNDEIKMLINSKDLLSFYDFLIKKTKQIYSLINECQNSNILVYSRLKTFKSLILIFNYIIHTSKIFLNYNIISKINSKDIDFLAYHGNLFTASMAFQSDRDFNELKSNSLISLLETVSQQKEKIKKSLNNTNYKIPELPSMFFGSDMVTINYDKHQVEIRNNLISEIKRLGFYNLNKISSLNTDKQYKIIDLIFQNELPYCIALLDYLGFLSHLKILLKNKTLIYKELAKILLTDERSVKGNMNVLNSYSEENRERYTAHLHKEKVKEDYNNII